MLYNVNIHNGNHTVATHQIHMITVSINKE